MSREYIQKVTRPLFLYGKGDLGKLAGQIFSMLFVPYRFFDREQQEMVVHENVTIAVCVATEALFRLRNQIYETFGFGYSKNTVIAPVWDLIEAYPEINLHNGYSLRGYASLEEIKEQYQWVYKRLNDQTSRVHYQAQRAWRQDRMEHLRFMPTPKNEFIGVNFGSNLIDVFERRRIPFRFIPPWTIIHGEGMDLSATFEYLSQLQISRAPLAVACYHSADGFYRIPHLLMSNLRDYDFYYRQHAHQGQAAYLYCVPKEMKL